MWKFVGLEAGRQLRLVLHRAEPSPPLPPGVMRRRDKNIKRLFSHFPRSARPDQARPVRRPAMKIQNAGTGERVRVCACDNRLSPAHKHSLSLMWVAGQAEGCLFHLTIRVRRTWSSQQRIVRTVNCCIRCVYLTYSKPFERRSRSWARLFRVFLLVYLPHIWPRPSSSQPEPCTVLPYLVTLFGLHALALESACVGGDSRGSP